MILDSLQPGAGVLGERQHGCFRAAVLTLEEVQQVDTGIDLGQTRRVGLDAVRIGTYLPYSVGQLSGGGFDRINLRGQHSGGIRRAAQMLHRLRSEVGGALFAIVEHLARQGARFQNRLGVLQQRTLAQKRFLLALAKVRRLDLVQLKREQVALLLCLMRRGDGAPQIVTQAFHRSRCLFEIEALSGETAKVVEHA